MAGRAGGPRGRAHGRVALRRGDAHQHLLSPQEAAICQRERGQHGQHAARNAVIYRCEDGAALARGCCLRQRRSRRWLAGRCTRTLCAQPSAGTPETLPGGG